MNKKRYFTFLIFLGLSFLIISVCIFPKQSLEAALEGIVIWWDVLFPALFPFFVLSEIMLGLGVVHLIGSILDPMMRPLFRVPGIGGFVMAIGFASGYPVAAKLTSQLWKQRLITRIEAERLVSFSTTSDPIFLLGAVAIGFFHNAQLALILVISHYSAAFLIGIGMRFYKSKEDSIENDKEKIKHHTQTQKGNPFIKTFRSMHNARIEDGRSFSTLLFESLQSSLRLIFIVGGLVVFFAVIMEILTSTHLLQFFNEGFQFLFHLVGMPIQLASAVLSGLFEVTLGARAAGQTSSEVMLVHKAAIAAWIVSWGGLSVHAQIVSILSDTPIRYKPFFFVRLLHGFLALLTVYVLWYPLQGSQFSIGWFNKIDSFSLTTFYTLSAYFFIATILIITSLFIVYRTIKALLRLN